MNVNVASRTSDPHSADVEVGATLRRQGRGQELGVIEGGLTDLAVTIGAPTQSLEDVIDVLECRLDSADGFIVELRHRDHVTGRGAPALVVSGCASTPASQRVPSHQVFGLRGLHPPTDSPLRWRQDLT